MQFKGFKDMTAAMNKYAKNELNLEDEKADILYK